MLRKETLEAINARIDELNALKADITAELRILKKKLHNHKYYEKIKTKENDCNE